MASDIPYYVVPEENTEPTWGDYAKSLGSGVTAGVVAPAASLARKYTEDSKTTEGQVANDFATWLQEKANSATEALGASQTEAGRKRVEAAITSKDFWEHPASAAMLKATGYIGPVAAMVFSGGPVGAALIGGAMGAGSFDNEIDKILDKASDADLRKNEWYDTLRSMGMSEEDARQDLKEEITGNRELINAIAGAVGGVLGPGAKIAGAISGRGAVGLAQEAGVLGRAGAGAAEGAAGGALQGGVENYTVQQTQIDAGLKKDLDKDALVNAVLEPGVIGGAMGAVAGAATGRRGARSEKVNPDETSATEGQEQGSGRDASDVEAAPTPVAAEGQAGTAQGSGVASEATPPQGAKGEAIKQKLRAKKKGADKAPVEIVEPGKPSPAEAEAIADLQQPMPRQMPEVPTPEIPPEVVQASRRLAANPEAIAPETPPQPAAPVPPDVTAAAQRVQQEVTPEVTRPVPGTEPTAVEPPAPVVDTTPKPVQVEVAPQPPKASGRVLKPIAGEMAKQAEANTRAANEQIAKNIVTAEKEAAPEAPKGKHWTKKEREARELSADNAKKIFDEHVPEKADFPTTAEGRATLRARLGSMLDAATEAGIKIPTKVGYEGTPDHVVYLRAAKDLHKKLGQKSFVGKKAQEAVSEFLVNERAAKNGDFSVLREGRKVAGDIAKRREQGDVELRGAMEAGASAEAEPVVTTVAKSARGAVRDSGSENAPASAVRKVELTEDAKKQAMAALERAQAKARGEVATNAVDRAEKPAAKKELPPKVAEAKAKVEAKAKNEPAERRRVRLPSSEISDNTHPGFVPVLKKRNALREYVNSLSDADYQKIPHSTTRALQDAASLDTLAKLETSVREAIAQPEAKPKAPEATSAKVVDKAAKKTDTAPSDAQKEAGNYAKGSVKWHGMEIAIENPKGSRRSGKSPDGREWSVEMPDHYGYVKRTKGADGDQVDVYMGPNPKSEKVFVIDQRDLSSGGFDEHKAMLGYDSWADAMQAYDRAFSDQRGYERIGDMQEMSPEEFKAWANSDKPKKAAKTEQRAREEDAAIQSAMSTDERSFYRVPRNNATGEAVTPLGTRSAREVLDELDLGHLAGIPRAIAEMMKRRLIATVGDVDVHVVDKAGMAAIRNDANGALDPDGAGVLGLHTLYENGVANVALREDALRDPGKRAHVVLHELAHAMTLRAIVEHSDINNNVRLMMGEVEAFSRYAPPQMRQISRYALTNTKEFIAEALSNPEFQEVLANTPVSDKLAARLKLERTNRASVWDALRALVQRIMGLEGVPQGTTMIDAVMRVSERINMRQQEVARFEQQTGEPLRLRQHKQSDQPIYSELRTEALKGLENTARETIERLKNRPERQEQVRGPIGLRVMTFDQIAQAAKNYWRDSNPVRKASDAVEMMRVKAADLLMKTEPVVRNLYSLEKKYERQVGADGVSMWQKFTSLVHDETMAGVYADRDLALQGHLGKDALKGVWGKARHAELAKRFAELPEDLRAARLESMKLFTDRQNAMSLGIIKNRILKLLGVDDDALAQRIHEGRTLDTDADLVGGEHVLDIIKEAKELAKIEGPYFPLMRRGDFVVRAEIPITAPSNARTLAPNEFEFSGKDARKDAIAWAEQQETRPTIRSVWVDKNTGERTFPDGTKVTSNDIDAENRFRVEVQNKHVDFVETAKEAQELAADLKARGFKDAGVEAKRYESRGRAPDMLSHQMQQLVSTLEKRKGFQDLSNEQQHELRRTLAETSLRFLGSTRIQSHRLPRRYVEGASRDLTRNTMDFAQSTSGYLARLEHQPQIDAAVKEMLDTVGMDADKTRSLGRSQIANEVVKRLDTQNIFDDAKGWDAVGKRLMTVSFLDKLFSPAFNIINSMQPAMVTMPTLAARYGVAKSFTAMSKAYNDIAALHIVGEGVKNTARKVKKAEATDLFADIKSRVKSSKEREMLDYLAERGSIDPEAGMEISRLIKSRDGVTGKLDTGLGYLEGMARQMPQAIEMINRSVTALATYRLEVGRGASHEKAMRAAQESVNNTQGLYSNTNAAPIFNHPVAKLSLQFKKYGQMMYHLLGQQVGKAWRNENAGDRAEALKTLAGLVATHTAMAGALGLPTEPFKYLLMGAQAAGLTSTGWSDVENKVRETASNYFGKTGGEILTRGLPHLAGIDLSSRVGLDSLTTFGEPRSNTNADVKSWLFDTVAGAPVALVGDWVKGANALTAGDFSKAAELMVPLKFASDSIKAYRTMSEGKKSGTGRETMTPYSPLEAAVRAAGFTPRREAETAAQRSAYFSQQKGQSEERNKLVADWVTAKPSEKGDAMRAVQSFNRGKPKDAQISMKDLTTAAKRRTKEESDGTVRNGMRTTKRDRHIFDRVAQTYNP